jgi:dihydrofolate reductase
MENVIESISFLRQQESKGVWLVGGDELISMLLIANLIDEMQIAFLLFLVNAFPSIQYP